MSKQKTSLSLLGFCVSAVMAMMAFGGPSGAQAAGCTEEEPTAKPCWMLNGDNVTSDTAVTAVLKSDVLILLLSKSLGIRFQLDCTEQKLTALTLEEEGRGTFAAEFKHCTTTINETVSKPCAPGEPFSAAGTLKIKLHENEPVVLVTGNPLSPIAAIPFPNEECALPNEVKLSGNGWILDCLGGPETELFAHLIQEGKLAANMLGGLTFGGELATIEGSLIVEEVKVENSAQLNFSILAG